MVISKSIIFTRAERRHCPPPITPPGVEPLRGPSLGGTEMEMDLDFKPGDVVQLNCGGPKMTVEAVQSDGILRCVWFHEDGKQGNGIFAQRASRCQS